MSGTIFRPGIRNVHIGGGVRIEQPGAAGNGLLNNLIAYWPGNEASGNALDLHTNALTLTEYGAVGSATGKVYALARTYTLYNFDYRADNALLSGGDTDFTIAAWFYMTSKAVAWNTVAGKSYASGQVEYALHYNGWADVMSFSVSPDGTAAAYAHVNDVGALGTGAWHCAVGWHDSVANTISIQVNGGAIYSAAHALGVFDGTGSFALSTEQDLSFAFTGRIGPTMFWKSAAGLGGTLDAAKRLALWNGGLGLPYASFTT